MRTMLNTGTLQLDALKVLMGNVLLGGLVLLEDNQGNFVVGPRYGQREIDLEQELLSLSTMFPVVLRLPGIYWKVFSYQQTLSLQFFSGNPF